MCCKGLCDELPRPRPALADWPGWLTIARTVSEKALRFPHPQVADCGCVCPAP